MLLQKESDDAELSIKSYQAGKIDISGKIYTSPILISQSMLVDFDDAREFSELVIETLIPQIPSGTEILIIGSGEKHQFLSAQAIKAVNDLGIALEVMDTRHACHTLQVLLHDNRKVVTLLFP